MPIVSRRLASIFLMGLLSAMPGVTAIAQDASAATHSRAAAPAAAGTGDIAVAGAWARATLPGTSTGAAYFSITNRGRQADTLQSLSSTAASTTELHRTVIENGMSRMRPAGALSIAAGQTLKAEPGGLHVMLTGLKQPLVAGARLPVVLSFRVAGDIVVQVEIRSATAMSPGEHPRQ